MQSLPGNLRYALRQFRLSPVFTAAAVLTLALGIGGTTAIFTLIHAVMLRSLPVSDPGRLYRVGEGDDCCVEGGPQDRWGMFSFPLYERLKTETPEFEEVAAFQAGRWRMSVRRQGVESAARPLRSEYVTGNYFSTLGVGAFGGRVFTPDDDKPAAPPVAVLSHRVWQTTYGGDPSVVGSSFRRRGPSVHRDRRRAAGILRRNAAQRSSRYLDSAAAGADDRWRRRAAASVRLRVAAHDRPLAAGSFDGRNVSAPHRSAAAMDAERFRVSRQLDARHDPHASQASRSTSCRPAPAWR